MEGLGFLAEILIKQMLLGQGKDVRGRGGEFSPGSHIFSPSPKLFQAQQKRWRGGGPGKKDVGLPPGFPLKKGLPGAQNSSKIAKNSLT